MAAPRYLVLFPDSLEAGNGSKVMGTMYMYAYIRMAPTGTSAARTCTYVYTVYNVLVHTIRKLLRACACSAVYLQLLDVLGRTL